MGRANERSKIMTKPKQDPQTTRPEPALPAPPAQGTTKAEFDRVLQQGTGDPNVPGSAAVSINAAGTPGGGTEVGGLGGTNIGDSAPENADLEAAAGSGVYDTDQQDNPDKELSFGPVAVENPGDERTPLPGLAPGGSHRGD